MHITLRAPFFGGGLLYKREPRTKAKRVKGTTVLPSCRFRDGDPTSQNIESCRQGKKAARGGGGGEERARLYTSVLE